MSNTKYSNLKTIEVSKENSDDVQLLAVGPQTECMAWGKDLVKKFPEAKHGTTIYEIGMYQRRMAFKDNIYVYKAAYKRTPRLRNEK